MSSINTNKQIQLKIDNKAKCQRRTFWILYNHYLLYLIDILCINSDIWEQCSKCAFTISIFAISVLYCRWKTRLTSSCSEIEVPGEAVPSCHDGMSPGVTWWSKGGFTSVNPERTLEVRPNHWHKLRHWVRQQFPLPDN